MKGISSSALTPAPIQNEQSSDSSSWGSQLSKSLFLAITSVGLGSLARIISRGFTSEENLQKTELAERTSLAPYQEKQNPFAGMNLEFPSDFPSPSPSPFQKVDIAYRSVYGEQESPLMTSDSLQCVLGLGFGGVASALTSNGLPLMLGSTLCAQKASAEFLTNKDDSKLKAHRKPLERETKYEESVQERRQESRSTSCPLFDFNNPFATYSTPVGQPGQGIQVAFLGDLTGDGINEFGISDPSATAPGNVQGAGKIWGIKGGTNVASILLTNFLSANGVVFYGPNQFDQLGFSMAALGNFTGTGYNAIVVGAPNNSGQPTNAYIIFDPFGNPVDFKNCDGLKCIKISGSSSLDFFGSIVACGYINKDNYADFLVTATQTSQVIGILGGPGPWPGAINSSSYNFVANGPLNSGFGSKLAIGPQGFAISAPRLQPPTNAGKLYYFKRNATFPQQLDLNLDGTPNGFTAQAGSNQLLGSAVNIANSFLNDGTPDIVVTGGGNMYVFDANPTNKPVNPLLFNGTNGGVIVTAPVSYGISNIIATGDFNGDGLADIVAGMPQYTPQVGLEQAGGVAFIWGQPGGLPSNIDVSTANSTYVYIAAGTVKGTALGTLVVNLGDIVGDGHQYVAVTTGTSTGTGTVFILRSQTIPPTCPTTTTTSASTTSGSSTTSPTPSSSLPPGAWAGIGIGAAVVIGGAVVAAVLALRHYQKGCFAQEDTSKPMQNNAYFKDDV